MSVYNEETTLTHSLNSLLNQQYASFEVVVVNDGSTDKTQELLEAYQDERLQVHHLEHVGLTKALNYGLSQCKGKYIARMDADDWSYPDRLQQQAQLLDEEPSIGVVSSLVEYTGDEKQNQGYALHVAWINTLMTHDDIQKKRFEDSPIANPSGMFRKSLIDEYGYYREGVLPEDYEFWLRLLADDVRFQKIDIPLLKWSDLAKRITRTSPNYAIDRFHEIKAEYLAKWVEKNYKEKPLIYVFGRGKAVNRKSRFLKKFNIVIHRFIDVKEPPSGSNVIHYTDLPSPDKNVLILSYVGDRLGKAEIIKHLNTLGYKEGVNYLMMT